MRQLTAFAVVFLNMRVVRPVFLPLLADANFADVQVAVCHPTVFVKSGEVFFLSAAATSFHLKMACHQVKLAAEQAH